MAGKLSIRGVESRKKKGRYGDGNGLYLQVSKWASKAWVYRYQLHGRNHEMGLGAYPMISLAEARDLAHKCRKQCHNGIDPIAARDNERQQALLEKAKSVTFASCCDDYIKAHAPGWSSAKHTHQWRRTLDLACKTLGKLPVAAVDVGLVRKVLEPIWLTKPVTASRTRQRIESVLDFAKACNYRTGDNPARWRGLLENLMPKTGKVRRVKHHAALPYDEVPEFMAELRADKTVSARALEFSILTGCRTNEVLKTQWSEIDLKAKTWTLPAERAKARKDHKVPLSDAVLVLLSKLPQEDGTPFVFISGRRGKPLKDAAMWDVVKAIRPDVTVHGFRSTFRDWGEERTSYHKHVLEMALGHSIGNKVEAAYRRGDLFVKRTRLMAEWARYCEQKPVTGRSATVVPLGRA